MLAIVIFPQNTEEPGGPGMYVCAATSVELRSTTARAMVATMDLAAIAGAVEIKQRVM